MHKFIYQKENLKKEFCKKKKKKRKIRKVAACHQQETRKVTETSARLRLLLNVSPRRQELYCLSAALII